MPDEEFETERQGLIRKNDYHESNAFIIEKVPDKEKKETLYVYSAIPILQKIAQIYKSDSAAEMKPAFIKRVQGTLSSLIFFVLDIENDGHKDPITVDGIPPFSR